MERRCRNGGRQKEEKKKRKWVKCKEKRRKEVRIIEGKKRGGRKKGEKRRRNWEGRAIQFCQLMPPCSFHRC